MGWTGPQPPARRRYPRRIPFQCPLRCCYDVRMDNDHCDLLCIDLPKAEQLRAGKLSDAEARLVSERAKALGDPTRLTIALALSAADELCVCDIAWIAERAENLVSHHLRSLRGAGLVTSRRDGKMVIYSLTPAGATLLAALSAGAPA